VHIADRHAAVQWTVAWGGEEQVLLPLAAARAGWKPGGGPACVPIRWIGLWPQPVDQKAVDALIQTAASDRAGRAGSVASAQPPEVVRLGLAALARLKHAVLSIDGSPLAWWQRN